MQRSTMLAVGGEAAQSPILTPLAAQTASARGRGHDRRAKFGCRRAESCRPPLPSLPGPVTRPLAAQNCVSWRLTNSRRLPCDDPPFLSRYGCKRVPGGSVGSWRAQCRAFWSLRLLEGAPAPPAPRSGCFHRPRLRCDVGGQQHDRHVSRVRRERPALDWRDKSAGVGVSRAHKRPLAGARCLPSFSTLPHPSRCDTQPPPRSLTRQSRSLHAGTILHNCAAPPCARHRD